MRVRTEKELRPKRSTMSATIRAYLPIPISDAFTAKHKTNRNTMSPLSIFLLAAIAFNAGAIFGCIIGNRIGKDEQFVDDFIAAGRRERERRDASGKFKKAQ